MKRRDFIKIITVLSTGLTSSQVFAQDKTTLQAVGNKMSDLWVQHVELETIPDDQIDFIDGFSNDQRCTFSKNIETL